MTIQQNWATNIQFQAKTYARPGTIEQIQDTVHRASKVRVIGSGHSFNDIADTTDTQISLERLDKTVRFDQAQHTATVPAGMTYIELAPILHQAGYALPNIASLPHITVIGACATATHGSGDNLQNLAAHVSALEIVNADGELVQVSRAQNGEQFEGMIVALGGLGVVTAVTLDLVPAFSMQQQVYRQLPLSTLVAHFDEIMRSGYSVSLFTRWQDQIIDQVWIKQILPDGQPVPLEPTWLGATLATVDIHPVEALLPDTITTQRGIPGPWYERLPHFTLHSAITGEDERQTEYFVPRENAVEALLAVEALRDQMVPFLKLAEVRSIAADKLWLSTAYGQDTIGIHFSWHDRPAEIAQFLPVLEARLTPFQARPHWGKMFMMSPDYIRGCYEKMADFQALLAEFDPQGKFSNAYLKRYIK